MTSKNFSPGPDSEAGPAAPAPELDALFAALRGVKPRDGFESRVLAHLQRESRTSALATRASQVTFLRRWAPTGIAASLACVLVGGLAVEREYSRSLPAGHATQASITAAGVQAQSSAATAGSGLPAVAASFGTASARREPAGAIPAGTRRGRATRSNATSRRIHTPSSAPTRPPRGVAAAR
jgi:hypothetical protein